MGLKGKEGQVAFVIWGESGVEETGGFPYRLVFANDDSSEITPLVSGLSSTNRQDALVYGQVGTSGALVLSSPGQLHKLLRWSWPLFSLSFFSI